MDNDTTILQEDLDRLSRFGNSVSKCVVMRCTRSLPLIIHNYQLSNQLLTVADRHPHLGVILDNRLSWSPHVSKITRKASRTFLKATLVIVQPQ